MIERMGVMAAAMGLVLALVGCGDSASDGGGGAGQGGAAQSGCGGSDSAALEALYACEELGFTEFRPLTGSEFDLAQGGFLVDPAQTSYVVHTTQIYVSAEKQGDFLAAFGDVAAQLAETEGLVAWAVSGDEACGVNRTLGIWESEQAMYAFVGSGAHATAMGLTTELSLTGKVTNWEATAGEVEALDWDVARTKLAEVEPSPIYR
jgi:heme-degrading monooxygenase HmoA